ncbi:MAG: hypothetical protein KAT52_01055 [Desulfobacterales bacterium]|jgi:hypothetical protein|nr:hypothetical protein [Desulfobacterales bacterium]MDL1986757.1 hypothetical protein [Deltaproteobacteria bacterium]
MVENIKKTISSTSFTSRVKKVDRQDADAQQRRFDRQLEEEDEKNKKKKQPEQTVESTGIEDSIEVGKEMYETDNRDDLDFDKSDETGDNTQGKLIDILV